MGGGCWWGAGGAEGGAPAGSGYPYASTCEPCCCCCCGCEPGYPCGNADDVAAAAPEVCTGVA